MAQTKLKTNQITLPPIDLVHAFGLIEVDARTRKNELGNQQYRKNRVRMSKFQLTFSRLDRKNDEVLDESKLNLELFQGRMRH